MNSHDSFQKQIIHLCNNAAHAHGLEFFGISSLNVDQDFRWFQSWLNESRHGGMSWLSNHLELRKNPGLLLEGAKSAFIFGFPYFLGPKHGRVNPDKTPEIAQYARLKDYHKFMRQKLSEVQNSLVSNVSEDILWRITVDSAPVLERALASHTNQCFVGKNTCIIHPTKGSYFLLGEIISSLDFTTSEDNQIPAQQTSPDLDPNKRTQLGGCGTCRRCQVHCPTGALDEDYRIDARKCLSYWTIEHRGTIPLEYWPWIGRYLFGCDICQNVCPYNRNVVPQPEAKRLEHHTLEYDLMDIIQMDQSFYEKTFGGTPMTRAKRSGLRRNALIAGISNRDPRAIALLSDLSNDPDECVRDTAAQAKSYLANSKTLDIIP